MCRPTPSVIFTAAIIIFVPTVNEDHDKIKDSKLQRSENSVLQIETCFFVLATIA